MKTKMRFGFLALFALFLLAAVCGLWSVVAPPPKAQAASTAVLDQVRGDVQIVPPGATAETIGRQAAAGSPVNPGEIVRVRPDSRARLALPDGTQVEIFAQTQLVFNEDLSDPEARGHLLGLVWGRILSRVVPRKDGGAPYKVVTPSSVCGVRGTEFIVAVAEDGETRVGVEQGEVEVSGADGTERLPAGTETSVAVGQKPRRPVQALLEKIDWDGWMKERNGRFREKMSERVASLQDAARDMDARLDQLNRRVQKIEAEAREFARQRREALDNGDYDLGRNLEARLKTKLKEGTEVNGYIAEARERRDVALASGEQALRGVAGAGQELQGRLRKLQDDLETFRASMAEKVKADQEVFGRRLQSFRDLYRESVRPASSPEGFQPGGAGVGLPAEGVAEAKLLERWNKLSPEKRAELKQKYEEWKGLGEDARQKIAANWERFRRMNQSERREILKNLREFERLGRDEKVRVREQFERWRALTPEKRAEIRKKFKRFKSLPPEERAAILERLRNRQPAKRQ